MSEVVEQARIYAAEAHPRIDQRRKYSNQAYDEHLRYDGLVKYLFRGKGVCCRKKTKRNSIKKLVSIYLMISFVGILTGQCHAESNGYPITDPFAATVIGTPTAYQASLPKHVPIKMFELPSIHLVPDIFWYSNGLRFSAALQETKAPLIFNIGGTGTAFDSMTMVKLQKALYQAGFHVVNLSSPTHINFQINGSQSNLPGFLPDDAKDLHRVMSKAYEKIKDDIDVSEFHVMGYSLGAAHAAFVAHLDKTLNTFNLQKVYMINPPVSLYNSVTVLDKMLNDNVEGGAKGIGKYIDNAITRLAASYEPKEGMRFDGDFLYRAYNSWPASKRGVGPEGRHGAAALIGITFRLTSGSMVFAGDLMSESHYIIPKDHVFSRHQPLNYYAQASHGVSFSNYVDDMIIPHLKAKYPGQSREDFIQAASLQHIEDFLKSYPKVGVVTNRDEIILASGELEYMESLFGERITIYDHGGHCGNMTSQVNINHMVDFFMEASL